jgi:hypothetical protein
LLISHRNLYQITSLIQVKQHLSIMLNILHEARVDQVKMRENQERIESSQVVIQHTVISSEETGTLDLPVEVIFLLLTKFTALLDILKPIHDARHDVENAPPGCLENTRKETIRLLMNWATNNTEDFIFWLSGLGGTGKTAVARTICDELMKIGALGAAFFVSRSSAERRDPQNIIRSITHQLAHFQPHLRVPICDALRRNRMVVSQSMSLQVPELLEGPLQLTNGGPVGPIIIVIDALDECNKDESGQEGGNLLPLLFTALRGSSRPVKLLVTSRLERSIEIIFSRIKPAEFRLHNIERLIVRADIRLYLEYSFRQIAERYSQFSYTQWPGPPPEVIEKITDLAGGLFIFAATVVKYIGNSRYSPPARLASFLSHSQRHESDSSPSPYDDLDNLYTHVLRSALGDDPRYYNTNGRRIRQLLGVLVVLFEPFSVTSLASLLGCDEGQLRLDLESLSAVILVPGQGSDETIQFFHASFQDYLSDRTRCTEIQFWIDTPKEFHDMLATRCYDVQLNHKTTDVPNTTESQNLDSAELVYARSHGIEHARWSDMTTIKKLVNLYRGSMNAYAPQHPNYANRLSDYSRALEVQIDRDAVPNLLEELVTLERKILELRPRGHPRRDDALSGLANALKSQFNQTGENEVLAEVINLLRESLELRSRGHPRRDSSLSNLAIAIQSQFNQTGEAEVLAEVIRLHRESLELRPRGHPRHDNSLNSLASALQSQFDQTGEKELLAEVIRLSRESLELRPRGHPYRDYSLNNLANALQSQFNQTDENELLAEVIRLHRESLELRPRGHPRRDDSLNNLANALRSRFDQTGEREILAEAIGLHRESLELRPLGHPHRGTTLNFFSVVLLKQFEGSGDVNVLEEAIRVAREVSQIWGPGHRYHQVGVTQLASVLGAYTRVTGDVDPAAEITHTEMDVDNFST